MTCQWQLPREIYNMKTFLQWAEDRGYDLSIVTDAEPSEKATGENRIRTGLSPNYPAAYASGQYPDGYFPPYKATAALDLKNLKRGK